MSLRYFITSLPVLFTVITYAQQKQKIDINHITVFLQGAEITGSSKVTLKQGENEILFTNVAGNIDQQSLSVGANEGVVVQSAVFQNNYIEDENISPLAKMLKDSIETVESTRSGLNNQLNVVNEQVNILTVNKQVAGANTGLSVAELQKMLDLVKAKLGSLLNEKDKLAIGIRKIDEQLTLLRKQYDEEKRKYYQPGGQVLVTFYSPKAVNARIAISYISQNAGWSPTYDLRVDKINSPVNLYYKANVYQNTGISWNNVKLSLSTGNPSEGSQAPVLAPWYLSFINSYPTAKYDGRLNVAGARSEATQYVVDGMQVGSDKSTLDNYIQTDNSGINTTFDIDIPYTILSDGKTHMVSLKHHELPATYSYYVVPRLDKDAFLQAKVINWETLDLLPAPTNIFYEGTFVGKGFIDMRTVTDTMSISLGRDKDIIVRREMDKELRSVKTIGSNIRETFAYTITVRNTRKEPINITIADQVPVSNDKDIVIEEENVNGATFNETTGEVTWTISIKPNETQKLKLGYTVKYPKGKRINI